MFVRSYSITVLIEVGRCDKGGTTKLALALVDKTGICFSTVAAELDMKKNLEMKK